MTIQPPITAVHSTARQVFRAPFAFGVLAGVLGAATLLTFTGSMQGILLDHAWRIAAMRAGTPEAFGKTQHAGGWMQPTKLLSGVNGAVLSPVSLQVATGHSASGDSSGNLLADVAPAALDSLSAGGCMTVTAKSGQTLSFRIVGARPASDPKAAHALPKIDLAITACANGEPVDKAVIDPVPQSAKATMGQRNL